VDLSDALRAQRLCLHGGAPAADTVAGVLANLSRLDDESVIGGDQLALAILEAATERLARI
jgi:hypothetical protein